jgi:hypothetical protein
MFRSPWLTMFGFQFSVIAQIVLLHAGFGQSDLQDGPLRPTPHLDGLKRQSYTGNSMRQPA